MSSNLEIKERIIQFFKDNPQNLWGVFSYGGPAERMFWGIPEDFSEWPHGVTVTLESSEAADDECSGPVYRVYKFSMGERKVFYPRESTYPALTFYLKFYGDYRSHEGSEYEGWREVTPTTKEVTVYE